MATWLIALAFFCAGLGAINNIPLPVFDEAYYIPTANHLLIGDLVANREHPPLGKELIALGIFLFGDNTFGWRIASLTAGTLGLASWSRAVWRHTRSSAATMVFAVLLATDFLLFALSQLAMLDVFVFAFTGAAAIAFLHGLERPRWMLASGLSLGLALACKWSAAPVALAMALWYFWLTRRRPLYAMLCFGLVPAAVYLATFAPLLTTRQAALGVADLPALQLAMARNLAQYVWANPIASQWWEWLINTRPIVVAQQFGDSTRIVVLGGNPVTMPAIAPAVALVLLSGRRFASARLPAAMFVLTLGFWIVSRKHDQYQFYFLIPSTFGMAVLAIVLARWRRLAWAVCIAALAVMAWFFPVLTGAQLRAGGGFGRYDWLPGWKIHAEPARRPAKYNPEFDAAFACLQAPRHCS